MFQITNDLTLFLHYLRKGTVKGSSCHLKLVPFGDRLFRRWLSKVDTTDPIIITKAMRALEPHAGIYFFNRWNDIADIVFGPVPVYTGDDYWDILKEHEYLTKWCSCCALLVANALKIEVSKITQENKKHVSAPIRKLQPTNGRVPGVQKRVG